MNKRSKETVKLNLNLRERNNTLFRSIFNEFTDENDSKVIRNLNKNTSLIKSSTISECSICLGKITKDSIVRKTLCNHFYHANCLDRWLEEKPFCPLCKKNLLVSSS